MGFHDVKVQFPWLHVPHIYSCSHIYETIDPSEQLKKKIFAIWQKRFASILGLYMYDKAKYLEMWENRKR